MARRRRMAKVKLDKNLALNTLIASLIVQQLPGIVNKYLLTGTPLSDTILRVIGAGGSILYGMAFKNNEVANIGVVLAGADLVNNAITSTLSTNVGLLGDFVRMQPENMLGDYTNNLAVVGSEQYADTYAMN